MIKTPSSQRLKALEGENLGPSWVSRFLREELERRLRDPAWASKWFRDNRGWIEGLEEMDAPEYPVSRHMFRTFKK